MQISVHDPIMHINYPHASFAEWTYNAIPPLPPELSCGCVTSLRMIIIVGVYFDMLL